MELLRITSLNSLEIQRSLGITELFKVVRKGIIFSKSGRPSEHNVELSVISVTITTLSEKSNRKLGESLELRGIYIWVLISKYKPKAMLQI